MRTTPEECAEIGHITATKLNRATGPVTVLIPLQGVSAIDKSGVRSIRLRHSTLIVAP
jgi:uncharacterized protein (UPF0261 family)